MMNTEVFKKLTYEAQKELIAAQVEELAERRGVKDPDLFANCFDRVMEEALTVGLTFPEVIDGFDGLAKKAFAEYHQQRKTQR